MSFPAMLDVVIGLIFLFLLMSMLVTAVNELLANALSLRAKGLKGSLERLIDDEQLIKALRATGIFHIGAASKRPAIGPSYLSGRDFALAVVEAIDTPKSVSERFQNVHETLEKLPDGAFKNGLLTVTAAAGEKAEQQLEAIGDYYDAAMDRASGVFRRWMQWTSLCVGFSLAFALNVDAIHVAKELWRDQALREQMSAAAVQLVELHVDNADYPEEIADINDTVNQLRAFPIGWNASEVSNWDFGGWITKFIGIWITAFATLLGAPFWFDTLKKVVKLRTSLGQEETKAAKAEKAEKTEKAEKK